MGDPSASSTRCCAIPATELSPRNRSLPRAGELRGEPRRGRLFILTNAFPEIGHFRRASSGLRGETRQPRRRRRAGSVEPRMLVTGFGHRRLGARRARGFGIGVWTTTVSSRVYRRRLPSFARGTPLRGAGRSSGTGSRSFVPRHDPAALAVLELKSALEEGIAHMLGLEGTAVGARELTRGGATEESP